MAARTPSSFRLIGSLLHDADPAKGGGLDAADPGAIFAKGCDRLVFVSVEERLDRPR